jgi:hypothetical protein
MRDLFQQRTVLSERAIENALDGVPLRQASRVHTDNETHSPFLHTSPI